MRTNLKSIPKFRSEAEERRFWETHDSGDFIDWTKAQRLRFPNLNNDCEFAAPTSDAS